MSPTAEEPAEDVERIVVPAASAPLLALLEAFVPILIVDFAGFGLGERFVGFGHFDEFLFGCFVASVSSLEGRFIATWEERTGSYRDGISCLVFGMHV